MAVSLSTQREMLSQLHRLSADREMAERQIRTEFEAASNRATTSRSDARQAAIMRFQLDRDTTQREYDAVVAGAKSEYDTLHEMAAAELKQSLSRIQADFAS